MMVADTYYCPYLTDTIILNGGGRHPYYCPYQMVVADTYYYPYQVVLNGGGRHSETEPLSLVHHVSV